MGIDDSLKSRKLAEALVGTWRLLSRLDRDSSGALTPEPTLGSDPLALLFFDGSRNFAAQFMKRDRSEVADTPVFNTPNNTTAVGGYDAYFGTYDVDEAKHTVKTSMTASLSASNVGMTATRMMTVDDDKLTIRLETRSAAGDPVTRTLIWERVG